MALPCLSPYLPRTPPRRRLPAFLHFHLMIYHFAPRAEMIKASRDEEDDIAARFTFTRNSAFQEEHVYFFCAAFGQADAILAR